jgi:hypothetical protein
VVQCHLHQRALGNEVSLPARASQEKGIDVDARVVEGPRQQNHGDIAHDQRIVHQARILGGPEDRPIARFDIDRVDTLDFVPGDQDLLDQGNPVMDAIGRNCE